MNSRKFKNVKAVVIIILAALVVLGGLTTAGIQLFKSGESVTCTVTEKDRVSNSEGKSDMRVYTKGCNGNDKTAVFNVSDNWFAGEFAAADTFADIEVGKTYTFETRGIRIPIVSLFPNIINAEAK